MSGKPRDTGSVYRLRVEALSGGHLGAQGSEASEMESTLPSAPWEAQGQGNKRRQGQSPALLRPESSSTPLPPALVLHPLPKAHLYPGHVTLLHLPISHLSAACTERCRHRAASWAASCGDCSRDREWPSGNGHLPCVCFYVLHPQLDRERFCHHLHLWSFPASRFPREQNLASYTRPRQLRNRPGPRSQC